MKKRLFAGLLALCMTVNLMSATVLAEEATPGIVCAEKEACTETEHDVECPLYVAPEVICEAAEGCLAEEHIEGCPAVKNMNTDSGNDSNVQAKNETEQIPENGIATILSETEPTNNGGLSGEGTAEAPYLINNLTELKYFRDQVNAGNSTYDNKDVYVKLTADIDLNSENWVPIGTNGDDGTRFSGTFDGDGKTISNLSINQGAAYHAAGLFGAIDGTVKNVTIDGANVESLSSGSATVNGTTAAVGSMAYGGTIDNVHVKNATIKGNRYVAGIVGYAQGTVTNCSVENVTIVATPDNLTGSYDNGDKVGGIVGYCNGAVTIAGNKLSGTNSITAYRDVAGIVGCANSSTTFANNTVDGTLNIIIDQSTINYGDKDANAGALVGRANGVSVADSNVVNGTVETTLGPVYIMNGDEKVTYTTLAKALEAAKDNDTICLAGNIRTDDILKIDKPVTIDGQESYTVTGTANKVFEVYADTVFKGVHITNTAAYGRCVDTRKNVNLKLNNCWLETTGGGNTQPLTIGGSDHGTTVQLLNTPIEAGESGYGIIAFVKCNVEVNARSHISGYAAVYMKEGTNGSVITVKDSNLSSKAIDDIYEFGTIVLEDDEITINVSDGSKIIAEGNENQHQAVMLLENHKNLNINVTEDVILDGDDIISGYNIAGNNKVSLPSAYMDEIPIVELEIPETTKETVSTEASNIAAAVTEGKTSELKVSEETSGKLAELESEIKDGSTKIDLVPVTEVVTKEEAKDSESSLQIVQVVGSEDKVVQYMDLSVQIVATTNGNSQTVGTLNEVSEELTFYVEISKDLQKEGRTFYVVRVHDGKTERIELEKVSDTTYSFKTAKFSDYAVVYMDNDEAVAEVEGEKHATLESAISAANGSTITLLKSVTANNTIAIDSNVVIDLNNYNITGADTTDPIFKVSDGSLELTGKGTVVATKDAIALYGNETPNGSATQAEVTVGKDVTVTSANANCIYIRGNGAKANVYGTLTASGTYAAIQGNGTYNGTTDAGRTEINIYDGATVTSSDIAIFHPQSGTLNVYGGTITGTTGIEMRAGTVNVSGGTITGNGTFSTPASNGNGSTSAGVGIAAIQHTTGQSLSINVSGGTILGTYALYQSNPESVSATPSLNVSGGSFTGTNNEKDAIVSTQCNKFVTGGSFSKLDAGEYNTETFTVVDFGDGKVTVQKNNVTENNAVAKVGNVYYETVAEAITAAASNGGSTVTLLNNAAESITIPASAKVVLDLAGHTLTGTTNNGKMTDVIINYGTLTIKDSSSDGTGTVLGGAETSSSGTAGRGGIAIVNKSGATCTIESGTIKREDDTTFGNYTILNEGTMTISGGTVTNNSNVSSLICNGSDNSEGTLTITGGTISQASMTAVKNDNGTLKISGGTISSANNQALQNWDDATITGGTLNGEVRVYTVDDSEATLNITGGTINGGTADGRDRILACNYLGVAENAPVINISGNAVINAKLVTMNDATETTNKEEAAINVSGGYFKYEVAKEHCAPGYKPVLSNGTYTVAKIASVSTSTSGSSIAFKVSNGKAIPGKYIDEDSEIVKEAKEKFKKWTGDFYNDFEFVLAADLNANIEKNTLIGIYASGVSEYDVVKILHKNHDGNWELIDSEAYNGYVVGEFDELSPVVVFVNEDAARGTEQIPAQAVGTSAAPAATGDSSNIFAYAALIAVAGIAFAILTYKKRRA